MKEYLIKYMLEKTKKASFYSANSARLAWSGLNRRYELQKKKITFLSIQPLGEAPTQEYAEFVDPMNLEEFEKLFSVNLYSSK